MKINPYLGFNGNTREAMSFYAEVLGGAVNFMTYADAPEGAFGDMCMPEESLAQVMHSELRAGDAVIMAADNPFGDYKTPQGFHVTLNVDDPAQAEKLFAALTEGGSQFMPIGEIFWAHRFGMGADRFGVAWMVNCLKPDYLNG